MTTFESHASFAAISSIVSIGIAVGFSLLLLVLPARAALRAWASGLWLLAIAVCLRQLVDTAATPAVVPLLAICGVLAGAFLLQGVCLHVQRQLGPWMLLFLVSPVLLALLVDALPGQGHGAWRHVAKLSMVMMYAGMAWLLSRNVPAQLQLSHYLASGVFAAHVVLGLYGMELPRAGLQPAGIEAAVANTQGISVDILLLIAQCFALMLLILEEMLCRLHARANSDGLTGLLNRAALTAGGQRALARADAAGMQLSLLIFDLDHFKQINDSWGHAAGDGVLRHFAGFARRHISAGGQLLGRYGGEEFVMVLPGMAAGEALLLARGLVDGVRASVVAGEVVELRYTVSVGVAAADGSCSFEQLVARADAALYRAKANGRDCAWLDAGWRLGGRHGGDEDVKVA